MIPLESAISLALKRIGFRKKARTWWRTCDESIQVLNLQMSPFGGRLYINLGVYVLKLGNETSPAHNRCHVQVRLEAVADERYWNAIVSAEPEPEPSSELMAAVLSDGVAWLERVSNVEGIRLWIDAGGSKKGAVAASVRELAFDS